MGVWTILCNKFFFTHVDEIFFLPRRPGFSHVDQVDVFGDGIDDGIVDAKEFGRRVIGQARTKLSPPL